ncbi:MAG: hypothetical protein IKC97_04895 [Clostridia bacterium]|nr:hypothetical protein [Clostridia bacterium]
MRKDEQSDSAATFSRYGNPKGIRPFGAFSWFVLWRVPKNEQQNLYTERAKLGEAVGEAL